jgi:uncharacterized protein YcfL
MKKILFASLTAILLLGCAGPGNQSRENSDADVVLEADVEAVLEQNIQLNERLSELENELDSLLNNL